MAARVGGRVQGVGFRWFVRREAQALGLSGWVHNEPDGTVSLEAEGSRPDVEDLAQRVRSGPPGSRVDAFDMRWMQPAGSTAPFVIR